MNTMTSQGVQHCNVMRGKRRRKTLGSLNGAAEGRVPRPTSRVVGISKNFQKHVEQGGDDVVFTSSRVVGIYEDSDDEDAMFYFNYV